MKRWHWVALALLALASVAAQFSAEAHYAWERIPAFFAIYGFVGCLLIIYVSKWVGKRFLQRDEDYYDRD